ncbi:hypothetical protein PAMP_019691 [Pampus punctatissimus]
MAVDVPGLVAVVVFYIVILVIGIWASRKSKKVEKTCVGSKSEVSIVGGRNINVLVGVFTMTATWVGGGYIMGTAEAVYSPAQGLIWAVGPPAYLINFLLGGLFFAKPMRSKRYVTMLDPFQHRYGNMFTTALLLPALAGDILWVACILAALGGTMSIILGLSSTISIIISAAVSIIYTFLGGLYSVAYTDIIQLSFIFVSLWLCIPFLILSPAVTDISQTAFLNQSTANSWIGELDLADAGKWTDEMLLLALGGLAYQALHQRILSAASSTQAQASERELQWVIRVSVLVVGLAGTALAFGDDSVFNLWLVSGDLLYCIIFPQLITVVHFRCANSYGAISGYVGGLLLRGMSGEPVFGIPPLLLFPGWREKDGVIIQYFPYRTLAMLSSLVCIIVVSWLTELVFGHQVIPQSWDILRVFKEKKEAEEEEISVTQEAKNFILDTKL